jgi:hypothetical protein
MDSEFYEACILILNKEGALQKAAAEKAERERKR